MTRPLNKKGRPFAWSISALQDFEGCPFRYAQKSFYYTVAFQPTEATRWGERVHKAAEYDLQGKHVSDKEALKPVEKYTSVIKASGWRVDAERQICLTENFEPIDDWFSKDVWLRVKVDYTMYSGDTAISGDWKTGKIKDNNDQLILTAAALSVVEPSINNFEGRFIWLKDDVVSNPVVVTKEEIPQIWSGFLGRVRKMREAWETENFPKRPTGLCGWCQVTNCEKRR